MPHALRPLLAALLLAAACTDARTPLSPNPDTREPAQPLQALDCALSVTRETMECGAPAPSTGGALGAGGVILGGQNVFVRLASSNVTTRGDTLPADVTIQNLISQPLGTRDGVTPHQDGVRIFFQTGPSASPSGAAWLGNPDGAGDFFGPEQAFFAYNTVLAPGATSAPRTWKFVHSGGVATITFRVYVAAQVQRDQEQFVITPANRFLLPGNTVRLAAGTRDFTGRTEPRRATWSSNEPGIATVDANGRVTALALGTAIIESASDGDTAYTPVVVVDGETAVRVEVDQDSATLQMGERVQLSATAYNVRGEVLDDSVIGWGERDINVATVNRAGRVRATYAGSTRVIAYSGWASDSTVIRVDPGPPLQWKRVTTGLGHTCGLTVAGKAYCWGGNGSGELGLGFRGQYSEAVPVAVPTDITFADIDAGLSLTCGVSTGGDAFCWGEAWDGQLGNGLSGNSTDASASPTRVLGGHRFARVSAGFFHACGIDEGGAAWCWGNDSYGQLGDGMMREPVSQSAPVAVTGGHTFASISASRDFTCAITTAADLYCWGDNEVGQLGDGNGAPALMAPRPVLVAGGRKWKEVATAGSHACAITTDGEAFCWGQDRRGELGRGTAEASSNVPAPVATTERFVAISAGGLHSCAVTAAGAGFCWGDDYYGTLASGTRESEVPHPTPRPMVGGVRFAAAMEGGSRTGCALGMDGKAYCWGSDINGEAGVQPPVEFCRVPGGLASCYSRPTPVTDPPASGERTGPAIGYLRAGEAAALPAAPEPPRASLLPRTRRR